MADAFVPIFFDWIEVTEELNDQEKGRLIDAVVLYARGGDWQERIKGNERFVFPAFRKTVDRSAEISAKRKVAGAAGGNQKQANRSKTYQNKANIAKPTEEEEEEEKEEYKRENITKEKKPALSFATLSSEFEALWELYPKKQGKKRAFEAFCRDRKKGRTYEEIHNGILAYKAYLSAEGTPDKYVKQGDTFFAQASWQDNWIPSRNNGSGGRWDLVPEEERDTELPF